MKYSIIFYGTPITKKNSSQILMNSKTGRPFIMPSKAYKDYEKKCVATMRGSEPKINTPVNVKMVYYMPTRRKVDLTNLQSATLDILVACGILEDDNSNIVVSTDGSRVLYDKDIPRVEIEITPASNMDM